MIFDLKVHNFIVALGFSIVVETIVIYLLIRFFFKKKIDLKDLLFATFLGTFATIPYVWFVFRDLFPWPYWIALSASELFAVVFEALLYSKVLKISIYVCLILSLLANLMSYNIWRIIFTYVI